MKIFLIIKLKKSNLNESNARKKHVEQRKLKIAIFTANNTNCENFSFSRIFINRKQKDEQKVEKRNSIMTGKKKSKRNTEISLQRR